MECKGIKRRPENAHTTVNCKKLKTDIQEGDLGIIESVTVQNFMCHENLTLNFGPHVNFIVGQNGSGKSAILTAIILALGGRSSSTDRFTNIKGFIKNGKNKAKIEVVLRNKGQLPHKPDLYGDKIIVIREFNKDGVSSYKIKSESGTICSNQKGDLINILEAMDIMVECPVCVLTQANSKKFLISKDARAERLYEFFYKGAGLELLEKAYKSMTCMKEETEANLARKIEALPILRKDIKKWKKFLDSSKRIYNYRNELIWARVIEMEKQVEEKEEEHLKIEKELHDHKKVLEGCKKSYSEKSSELDELNNQKEDIGNKMNECRETLGHIKAEFENISSSLRQNKGSLQKLENDKKKLNDDILGMQKCINEQKMKNQAYMEEENKKRHEAIQKLKEENSTLEEELKTTTETINTSRSEKTNFETVIDSLKEKVNQNKYEVDRINSNLVSFRNAIKSKVNAFGEHTDKVLVELKRRKNSFSKPPYGPIGIYLEVPDPKWAAAIEFAISGSLLNSFCVDNHEDAQLLRTILGRFYKKIPSIIVSQYESEVYDIQHEKVQSKFPTVFDMLKIKHHVVTNCLIDQAQIEKKILVEDENAAGILLNNQPRNCFSAYFLNCDQICYNPSRFYSFGRATPRCRLNAIREEDISKMQNEIKEKLSIINKLEQQIEVMKNNLDSIPSKIQDLERNIMKISALHRRNLFEIKELECREEPKDVDCMREELQALHQAREQVLNNIESVSKTVSDLESARLDFRKQLTDQSDSLKIFSADHQRLDEKISGVLKLKESFGSGKTRYESELKRKENEFRQHLNRLREIRTQLENACSKAESVCPRINTDKSCEEIQRLINETQKVVEAQSECDRKDIYKKYKEKVENLQKAEIAQKEIESFLKRIGDMLVRRYKNLVKIRQNTELLTGLTFTTLLSGNGYTGHLEFDEVKKTLKLSVSPRAGDRAQKNHSSLSGGERSFVTITFLLALWGRTRMPFRILDEYDVFMDSNNRQLSVDLLCRNAIQMDQTQFVFLSPLDLPRLPPEISKYVQTLKMAAPKRKTADSPQKKHS